MVSLSLSSPLLESSFLESSSPLANGTLPFSSLRHTLPRPPWTSQHWCLCFDQEATSCAPPDPRGFWGGSPCGTDSQGCGLIPLSCGWASPPSLILHWYPILIHCPLRCTPSFQFKSLLCSRGDFSVLVSIMEYSPPLNLSASLLIFMGY